MFMVFFRLLILASMGATSLWAGPIDPESAFGRALRKPSRLPQPQPDPKINPCMRLILEQEIPLGDIDHVSLHIGTVMATLLSLEHSDFPLVHLALVTLGSSESATEKLMRLQLIHYVSAARGTIAHPEEGEALLKKLRDERFNLSHAHFQDRYLPGITENRARRGQALPHEIHRAEYELNEMKPMFELFNNRSMEFKQSLVAAAAQSGRPGMTECALAHVELEHEKWEYHRRKLFMLNLAQNSLYIENLPKMPRHVLTEEFIREVFEYILQHPTKLQSILSWEATEKWVPELMKFFIATLAESGIQARVVYSDHPDIELSAENWNQWLEKELVLVFLE